MTVDDRTLDMVAMSREEYARLVEMLDREPTEVELGMTGALWSEHCGYKHSRPLFHHFPTEGPYVLTKVGEENAGAIDLGDGWCAVFKMESHNHPSALEPYQGAATGVGGILRDIIAMGMRPVALLDSLRFGPLSDAHNRHLFTGVVGGIGGYGNCIGVPTVGGEVQFDPAYSGNPLVNAMCVGVGRIEHLLSGAARGPGNPLLLVGADTGRDGIHGATFASVELDEGSGERRPAVQVGNPFLEKLLMEACVELAERHGDWIEGLEDLGRRRAHLQRRRGGGARRHRRGDRRLEGAAPRARNVRVRRHALGVAGAHARDPEAGAPGRRDRALPPLGGPPTSSAS